MQDPRGGSEDLHYWCFLPEVASSECECRPFYIRSDFLVLRLIFFGNDFMCETNKMQALVKFRTCRGFGTRELTLGRWPSGGAAQLQSRLTRNHSLICTVVIPLSEYHDSVPHYYLRLLKYKRAYIRIVTSPASGLIILAFVAFTTHTYI